MNQDVPRWEVVGATRDKLGESPLWHPNEQALYWIDFFGPLVHRRHLASGAYRSWRVAERGNIGAIALATGGRLILALDGGLALFDPESGASKPLADPNAGRPGISYNDAKVDRDGNLWCGTFDIAERAPRGILYRLARDGNASIGDSGFVVCNGPAFSPDGTILYFSDSIGRRILAYDLERVSGRLSVPRTLVAFGPDDGMPDGLCVDSQGVLYCAHYGGGRVTCFDPDGAVQRILRLPVRNVTSCCLGNRDLRTLYVTTGEHNGANPLDGALFSLSVAVPGLPEPICLTS